MASARTRTHRKVAQTADLFSSSLAISARHWHDLHALLRTVGLRLTSQRIGLAGLLFGKGNRHITAEELHLEATKANVRVSLATVYNTLNQFTEMGLVRQLTFDGSKSFFDTNTSRHHHFFVEGENRLLDIAAEDLTLDKTPMPPEALEISRIDVTIRLRRKGR